MRALRIALIIAALLIMTFGHEGFVEAAKHPPSMRMGEGYSLDV